MAVYLANIHRLINEVYIDDMLQQKWISWGRMALQFVVKFGVYWAGAGKKNSFFVRFVNFEGGFGFQ